jgi:hypothetical protein
MIDTMMLALSSSFQTNPMEEEEPCFIGKDTPQEEVHWEEGSVKK